MVFLKINVFNIKINDSKSPFITFSLRPNECPPILLKSNITPTTLQVIKYLGLKFDRRLTWAQNLNNKRKSVDSGLHLFRSLLSSKLAITNKLLIYKIIIRPVWPCGIPIWGFAKPSNLRTTQISSLPIHMLYMLMPISWCIKNINLHNDDLKIPTLLFITTN